jgi:hypothetical protein
VAQQLKHGIQIVAAHLKGIQAQDGISQTQTVGTVLNQFSYSTVPLVAVGECGMQWVPTTDTT